MIHVSDANPLFFYFAVYGQVEVVRYRLHSHAALTLSSSLGQTAPVLVCYHPSCMSPSLMRKLSNLGAWSLDVQKTKRQSARAIVVRGMEAVLLQSTGGVGGMSQSSRRISHRSCRGEVGVPVFALERESGARAFEVESAHNKRAKRRPTHIRAQNW